MMSGEAWARVTLRVRGQRPTVREIEGLLGAASESRSEDLWALNLAEDSAVELDEQLRIAKRYLRDKAQILEGLTDTDISLCIGWTPRSPQDGIIMDAELIALLAAIRCDVLLDTYLD
jgi:hypothetical protein